MNVKLEDPLLLQNCYNPVQSRFVLGGSAINQLIDIYHSFCKALDEGNEVSLTSNLLLWLQIIFLIGVNVLNYRAVHRIGNQQKIVSFGVDTEPPSLCIIY